MFGRKAGDQVIFKIGTGHTGELGTVIEKVSHGSYAVRVNATGEIVFTGLLRSYKGPKKYTHNTAA